MLVIIYSILGAVDINIFVANLKTDCESEDNLGDYGICRRLKFEALITRVNVLGVLLDIYFWICSFTYYLEVKAKENNPY